MSPAIFVLADIADFADFSECYSQMQRFYLR
ncbi:hypothetical protein SAMN05444407_107272 [Chryseobacterium contaminans]|uniref:Uncharacterized protein n=1 Tax=Chryseobacterium contaminans TaxID=1423959 RepID=A0A1M7EQ18_9FLAO|nr:hypothetical protein SAMN05444407_107272 [Chryseobacterium contaminans]